MTRLTPTRLIGTLFLTVAVAGCTSSSGPDSTTTSQAELTTTQPPETTTIAPSAMSADCNPMPEVEDILLPGQVMLVGELHGTNEGPAFVAELVCQAASSGESVILGLEIPGSEATLFETFLDSAGEAADVDSLVTGMFWTDDYQDGRASEAMVALLDRVRSWNQDGAEITITLLDVAGGDRDTGMATALLGALDEEPEAISIALTGNVHAWTVLGTDFNPDYEPFGYQVTEALGADTVTALDMAFDGGNAWVCTEDGCGVRDFDGSPSEPVTAGEFRIEFYDEPTPEGMHASFDVGSITASLPAVGQ